MLNAFVYCPRLFHLEWVQSEWAESEDTIAGTRDHRRVDQESGVVPGPESLLGEGFVARSVMLSGPVEGLIARIDVLEGRDGQVVPVDYKHGHAPEIEGGAWEPDRAQLCAQALVLRENGYPCREAVVYYVASKRRVIVPIDDALVATTRASVAEAREVAAQTLPPPPLVDSPKCPRCSLVGICLPDEDNQLLGRVDEEDVRRLYPARDDALPVYVQAQGARIGKSGDELEIVDREEGKRRARLLDISQVCLFGSVQISAQAISALLREGIPICHFSYGGWFNGITHGIGNRNCDLRLHQYEAFRNGRALDAAKGFVTRKILNQRTLLRRNGTDVPERVLADMEQLSERAGRVQSAEELLGVEGAGARAYFENFGRMLRPPNGAPTEFDFAGRNRRPPLDPVNALLSLAYSALSRDWTVTLLAVGLDPFLGLFHAARFGRPALALDLMEEFRPLIGDSIVLQLVNSGEVGPDDFIQRAGACNLTDSGRKRFFGAYERRMAQLIRHPVFGYRVSYRRLLEVQARLFGRWLSGELPSYDGFRTR